MKNLVYIIKSILLNQKKDELPVATSNVKSSFVTRNGTHFCYKCGWIDDIEVTMERKEYTDSDGKTDISYFFIDTDRNLECPDCKRRTVKPLTTGNTVYAVGYLLRALR